MGKLDNKVAIVTGGARGIGEDTVRAFAAEGAKVVFTDILEEDGQRIADELGADVTFAQQDVADEARWAEIVELTESTYGKVDVLVNNAGVLIVKDIEDTTVEEFNRLVFVNQTSQFIGMKAVLPAMRRAGGGSIVNMSSAGAFIGTPGNVAYGATKWAIRGMTKTAAMEFAKDNIRVNSVHPAIILTPMIATDESKEIVDQVAASLPMGRGATGAEVAAMNVFLASDDASFSTGSEFLIDGGLTAF